MAHGRRALLIGGVACAVAAVTSNPQARVARWLAGEPLYEQEINDAAGLLRDETLLRQLESFADTVLAEAKPPDPDPERGDGAREVVVPVRVPRELQALCGEDGKRTSVLLRSAPPRMVLHCGNHRYAAVVYANPSTHEADEHTRRASPRTVIIGT